MYCLKKHTSDELKKAIKIDYFANSYVFRLNSILFSVHAKAYYRERGCSQLFMFKRCLNRGFKKQCLPVDEDISVNQLKNLVKFFTKFVGLKRLVNIVLHTRFFDFSIQMM